MKEHLKLRLSEIISVFVVLLIIVGFQTIAAIGQVVPGLNANLQMTEDTKEKNETPPVTAELKVPFCPPAGHPTLQASSQVTGHHKVILSWNASTTSVKPDSKVVGYCLYRNKKKNAAKQNATCNDCEQINSIPIAGTSCVDDLVEDGATYYYVVTAINAKGETSSSSNEIPAQIPPGKESTSSVAVVSYPLCRTPTSSK